MFGEYLVYVDDNPLIMVCDNTVFVKQLECLKNSMNNAEKGTPYEGAKEHYILDIDDSAFCFKVISIIWPQKPYPKHKRMAFSN